MFRRLFLSYGHDKATSFVVRLKNDLVERGYQVWFDEERLRAGIDWERYIEEGLDSVSQIWGEGCLVLIMTPHSVRRPNGFCLNEIARANMRGLPIVPIMLVQCEPPLSICRTQWLDMRDCLDHSQPTGRYRNKFAQLMEALENGRLDFEGVQSRLSQHLQPLSFDAEVSEHLPRFKGRQWLFRRIDAWFARSDSSRIFWITGPPGFGKTAIVAWLGHHYRQVAALHFCRHGHVQKSDPRRALLSIAYQLSSQVQDYAARLNSLDLARLIPESNALTLFDDLFVQALSKISPPTDNPLAIVIDALDEASSDCGNELADCIATQFQRTPSWIRLITTSRLDAEVKHKLQGLTPYVLDAHASENLEDIRCFIASEFRPFARGKRISRADVMTILRKSEGNFLYAEWLRRECEFKRFTLSQVNQFPQGLGGIYAQFFSRQFGKRDWFIRDIRPLLEMIAAAREPLDMGYISASLHWSEYERERILGSLGSLFAISSGRVWPFHQSVMDWLTNPEQAGDYLISRNEGLRRHDSFGWQTFESAIHVMPRYSIVHLPAHLGALNEKESELRRLLLDFNWMQAKLEASDVASLCTDYDYLSGDPALKLVQETLRLSAHVLATDKNQLAGQLIGRLLDDDSSSLEVVIKQAAAWSGVPWLQPLTRCLTSPRGPLRQILRGHGDWVNDVAVYKYGYGLRAISASNDKCLKVWDLASGCEVMTLRGHSGYVHNVAVTPDGKTAVSSSNDHTVKLWDLADGRETRTLRDHASFVNALVVTPDGKRVVAAVDSTVKLWDIESGEELFTLKGHHNSQVSGIAVTADGRQAISASWDGTLKVWDLGRGQEVRTLPGHRGWVTGAAITPDGECVVSSSWDNTLKVWSMASGTEMHTLEGHAEGVNAVAVTPDGRVAVSASQDHAVKIWDLARGKEVDTLTGHSNTVHAVAVTPDGKLALSASTDNTVRVWDLVSTSQRLTTDAHKKPINTVAFTPDGDYVLSGSEDNTVKLWELATGRTLSTLQGHSNAVTWVAIVPDGKRVISASADHTLKVWEIASGRTLYTLQGHSASVTGVAVTANGQWAVSSSQDHMLKVWDLASGRVLRTLETHHNGLTTVTVTLDGQRAIAGSYASVRVWELTSDQKAWTLESPGCQVILRDHDDPTLRVELPASHPYGWVKAVTLAPDERWVLSACEDKTLKLWDLKYGRAVRTLEGHSKSVNGVAVTGDGQCAVSASDDFTLKLWELESGKSIATFTGDCPFLCCATAPDRAVVASGDQSGRLHILKVR